MTGTKAALHYVLNVASQGTVSVHLRLVEGEIVPSCLGKDVDPIIMQRQQDADAFYQAIAPFPMSDDARAVQRQALPGCYGANNFIIMISKIGSTATRPCPNRRPRAGRAQS